MHYPNREELVRMGLAVFAVYLGIYYWTTISHGIMVLLKALYPVLLGCAIAYVVNIPMRFFEKQLARLGDSTALVRTRRSLSLLLTIAIGAAAIAFLVRFIVPELLQSVRMMSTRAPQLVSEVRGFLRDLGLDSLLGQELDQLNDWQGIQTQVSTYLMSGAGGMMGSVARKVSTALSSTFTACLGAILAVYILMTKERLCGQVGTLVETYMGPEVCGRAREIASVFDHSFNSFIVGRCLVSVLLGFMCLAGMLIFRFPYAITISTVVGVSYIIPVVGGLLGAVIGGLLIFSVSPVQALFFLVFLLVLEQFEANVVFPHVVGSATGLPSIWVLVAIVVGGGIGGVPAILMSVPIAAAIYQLLVEDVHTRNETSEAEPLEE